MLKLSEALADLRAMRPNDLIGIDIAVGQHSGKVPTVNYRVYDGTAFYARRTLEECLIAVRQKHFPEQLPDPVAEAEAILEMKEKQEWMAENPDITETVESIMEREG